MAAWENEQRDEHGKWSSGGGSSGTVHAFSDKLIAKQSAKTEHSREASEHEAASRAARERYNIQRGVAEAHAAATQVDVNSAGSQVFGSGPSTGRSLATAGLDPDTLRAVRLPGQADH